MQGWKTVSMSYGDMISSMCNGSTTIQEVYDCINTNTYNLTEVVPSLSQGASIPKCRWNVLTRSIFSS